MIFLILILIAACAFLYWAGKVVRGSRIVERYILWVIIDTLCVFTGATAIMLAGLYILFMIAQ